MELVQDWILEKKKRRREILIVLILALFFGLLTWFELRLFAIAQQLPFVHSVFFFGLVNFNIILLLFLLFMIFRNLVKVFVERKNKVFGSSLKAKLIIAFLSFTIIPTALIFFTNVTYVNSSFDKWFSSKVQMVLKMSIELSQSYYFAAKKRNYHFAFQVAQKLERVQQPQKRRQWMQKLRSEYALDALEYYTDQQSSREIVLSEEESIPMLPYLSDEVLSRSFENLSQSSLIQPFSGGNLVRVIVPIESQKALVVVTTYIPLSLLTVMNDISNFFEEFQDSSPLQYPLKSIYLTILVLMTLVIIFAAIWFGFYLARQLAIPLVQLGEATQRIAEGSYDRLDIQSGSEEIASLVTSFNQMSQTLALSEEKLRKANQSLTATLQELDQHSRYNEEVLSSISAGVLSVDHRGKITTMNRHAGDLLKVNPQAWIGKSVRELLTIDYFRTFAQLIRMMNEHKVGHIQRELRVPIEGETIPLSLHLSILRTNEGVEIGKLAVFDDLSPIIQAQRAAAWREVARRIAHEIKNPLTPIKLSAERLLRKFGQQIQDPAFEESVKMIIQQSDELKVMVNEFSQFARLPEIKLREADLHEVISDTLILFEQSYREIEFTKIFDLNINRFLFDPEQIGRVMTNLIDNAVSALKESSKKHIVVKTEYSPELRVVKVSVLDSGSGIPWHAKAQIFEPYFTTKKEGSGLGLAIVKRIIEDHNGFIRVLDNVPTGTQMVFEIPVG